MSHNLARDQRRGRRGTVEGRKRWRMRPTLMALEDRRLLSTIVVNNPTDTPVAGQTDLRQAIVQANTTGGDETIVFDKTVFETPQTITLAGTQLELSDTTGTETIIGPAGGLTISGGGLSRVFEVDSGVTATISGMTITGGDNSGYGGGIYDNSGTLTVTDCTLSGNSAANGGALSSRGGSVTVANDLFTGNQSTGVGSGGGGAIFVASGGTLTVTNSTFSSNTAAWSGGAINSPGISLTITGATFVDNVANATDTRDSGGGGGGAVGIGDGTVTINNSTFFGNRAPYANAGAIYSNYEATFTIADSTIDGNSCYHDGGGIDQGGTAPFYLVDTIIAGDSAGATGPDACGSFDSQGHNLIGETNGSSGWVGSDFTGTVASPLDPLLAPLGNFGGPTQTMGLLPGSPAIGSGIVTDYPGTSTPISVDERGMPRGSLVDIGAFQTSLVVESSSGSVDTNAAGLTLPGAVLLTNQFPYTVISFDPVVFAGPTTISLTAQLEFSETALAATITGPAAGVTLSGGGTSRVFQVDSGVIATLSGLTILGGSTTGYGGGLYNDGGTVTLTDVTISSNIAGKGGGLFNTGRGTIGITGCSITGNSATNGGGGLYNYQGTVTLNGGTVTGNRGAAGGGLFNTGRGTIGITGCSITGNSATNGGGLYNYQGTVTLSGGTVSGNSGAKGGGLFNTGRGTIGITSCSMTDNSATGGGGGLYNAYGTATLLSVTVSGNTASGGGGLFNSGRGTIGVTGCSVTGNTATSGGGGLYNDGGMATLNGGTLSGNTGAAGGGLFNTGRGTIGVTGCSVTGNSATNGGGGLYNDGGIATLSDVTVSGNIAGKGGGVFNSGRGTIGITSCTVGDNSAGSGGGLYNYDAAANLDATTIGGNSAASGGGIDNTAGGGATLEDTIVATNTGTGGTPSDIGGASSSAVVGTYDLVGTGSAGGIAGGTGDIVLSSLNNLGLASLGNYGGSTATMPLLPGSAAIDAGTTIAGVSTDQRGLPPSSPTPDIGAFQSQGFTFSVVAGSTPQAVPTGAVYTNPLAVIATPINPVEPVAGGVVTFTVNPGPNGASATLSSATAIIGSNGIAEVSATANSIGGPYTVTATAAGGAPTIDFHLKNLIILTYSGVTNQITYGPSSETLSGTLANGTQTPAGENVSVTFDGLTQQALIGSTGAFSTTFDTGVLPVAGSPYPVSYAYTSDGTFASASTTIPLVVMPATPTITWANPAGITYGTVISAKLLDAAAAWTVGGVNGAVSGSFTYTPAAGTVVGAGVDTLSVTFTPTDTSDFNTAFDSVTINVAKATPTVAWASPAGITYGTALSATQLDATSSWTVGGVNGAVAGTFTYTPAAGTVLSAGTGESLSVTFTPTDTTDFNTASDSVTINVAKATPDINWSDPGDITYGTALSATQLDAVSAWTVGGVDGAVAGTFTYTPAAGTVLHPGSGQTLSVTFTPSDATDFNTASDSVTINVAKATPTVTWATPAEITYGTALSATQLDATSSWTVGEVNGAVAGTFAYTPAAGTVLGAGTGQTLSVAFTPTDTTDYASTLGSVTINVAQAAPTITWANPADITYGTALSPAQLDATSSWTVGGVSGSVEGTFTYSQAVGAVLAPGTGQTLSVTFIPTDRTDYQTTFDTVAINVDKATPTIIWSNPYDITYGTALSATQLDATSSWTVGGGSGSVAGSFAYTPAAGTVLAPGAGQTLSVTFTPTDTTDYNTASATATINVLKALPTITWANPASITRGTTLSATQLDATASVPGTFVYTPGLGTDMYAGGNWNLSVTFTPTNSTDYATASDSVTINVAPATPNITWPSPAAVTYGIPLSATQLDATSSWTEAGVTGSVAGTFTYTPALGTVLKGGANQTLSVTFTPSDTTNYTTASATTTINVDKATPAIIWYNPIGISYGTALTATQLNARALIAGSFVYSPPLGTILDAGLGQTLTATFTPTDTTDYAPTVATVTINVDNGTTIAGKLTPTLKVTDPGGQFDVAAFPASVTVAGSGTPPAASLEGVTPTLTYYNSAGTSLGAAPPTNAGNYTVVAAFAGSVDYAAVRSAPVPFTIAQEGATIALASSVTSAVFGESVTFVATVAAVSSGTPGGTVTFSDGGTALATVALGASGKATLTTSGMVLGSNSITATYSGDSNFLGVHTQALTELVAQAGTQVVLVPEPVFNSKHRVVSVSLKAEVEPVSPGSGVPTGMVTFETVTATKKPKKLGTLALSGGEATLTLNAKLLLNKSIKIIYSGDADFTSSTASPSKLTQAGLKSLARPMIDRTLWRSVTRV